MEKKATSSLPHERVSEVQQYWLETVTCMLTMRQLETPSPPAAFLHRGASEG